MEQKKNCYGTERVVRSHSASCVFPHLLPKSGANPAQASALSFVSPLNGGRGIKMLLCEIETEALEGEVTSRGRESEEGERLG